MAASMHMDEKRLAMDVFSWFGNVSTSVLIVFVNKVLMDPKWGYKFVFGALVHFVSWQG
jgi:solute carrier family 35 protein E3